MEPTTIIAIIIVVIAIIVIAGGIICDVDNKSSLLCIGICSALSAVLVMNLPEILSKSTEHARQATADSYNIQAYYEVESMRRIEEEDWFLFFHIGENEYIEAVIIKDGKKETAKFNTDSFFDRIRIDQREHNAIGVDVKGKYHLYITQEDYDKILGYQ